MKTVIEEKSAEINLRNAIKYQWLILICICGKCTNYSICLKWKSLFDFPEQLVNFNTNILCVSSNSWVITLEKATVSKIMFPENESLGEKLKLKSIESATW